MGTGVSAIYRSVPSDIDVRLSRCLDRAGQRCDGPVYVFFRADDTAVPGQRFSRLVDLFTDHRLPLNPAVVPAWITDRRWRRLRETVRRAPSLFCWHQHGWRHVNHEPTGKKQEFGPARSRSATEKDLLRGRSRLEQIMGRHFFPVFTPPWNRCGRHTLELLRSLEYAAVSRSSGSLPTPPADLVEIPVHADLHTMRHPDPMDGWQRLLSDMARGIAGGRCGIMIHHQRMNDAAFGFLDMLLGAVGRRRYLQALTFRDLMIS